MGFEPALLPVSEPHWHPRHVLYKTLTTLQTRILCVMGSLSKKKKMLSCELNIKYWMNWITECELNIRSNSFRQKKFVGKFWNISTESNNYNNYIKVTKISDDQGDIWNTHHCTECSHHSFPIFWSSSPNKKVERSGKKLSFFVFFMCSPMLHFFVFSLVFLFFLPLRMYIAIKSNLKWKLGMIAIRRLEICAEFQ